MAAARGVGKRGQAPKPSAPNRRPRPVSPPSGPQRAHAASFENAREAGLLDGERTAHVSFRAPPALVEAAMKESGVTSPSELGILALTVLAQPDPVAAFLRKTRGRLGKDHTLEY